MGIQRTRGKRRFGSVVNLGTGNLDDATGETGKLQLREELGEVVGNIMFRRAPEAPYPRGFSVFADSVAYSEFAKLNMLRLLGYFRAIRSRESRVSRLIVSTSRGAGLTDLAES